MVVMVVVVGGTVDVAVVVVVADVVDVEVRGRGSGRADVDVAVAAVVVVTGGGTVEVEVTGGGAARCLVGGGTSDVVVTGGGIVVVGCSNPGHSSMLPSCELVAKRIATILPWASENSNEERPVEPLALKRVGIDDDRVVAGLQPLVYARRTDVFADDEFVFFITGRPGVWHHGQTQHQGGGYDGHRGQ